jgi:hypothetical protein
MSRSKDIAEILGLTEAENTTNASLGDGSGGGSVTTYATPENLPTSGNSSGDQAFVTSNNRLYIWNGSGWYNIALINTNPSFSSSPDGSYELATDGSSTTITLVATDPEGVPITYTTETDSNFDGLATVSNDSSVFTITPLSSPTTGSGNLTFKASDGVNIGSAVSQFTLTLAIDNSAYTIVLAKATGNAGTNTTFTDGSTNSHTITTVGNAHSSSFTPFHPGGYSAYFDGSGDYLTIPSSTDFNFGTNAFTVEWWQYWDGDNGNGYATLYSNNYTSASGVVIQTDNNVNKYITYLNGTGTTITESTAASANQWYHYALVRNGNTFTFYRNGIAAGTATLSVGIGSSAIQSIGARTNGILPISASYIRDFRIVKGTAVYTTDFTPPAEPLTAISGTSLLVCSLPYITDASASNHTITANGNTSTERFGPYDYLSYSAADHGSSVSLDGSGDKLTIPADSELAADNGDFTFETWIYPTAFTSYDMIASMGTQGSAFNYTLFVHNTSQHLMFEAGNGNWSSTQYTSSVDDGIVKLNQWQHIAVVYDSGNLTIYRNGKIAIYQASAATADGHSGTFALGDWMNTSSYPVTGYIADARIVQSAVYSNNTAFTPPTAPLSAITDTGMLLTASPSVYDAAGLSNDLKLYGTAQSSTTQVKNASSSLLLDGNSDYVTIDSGSSWASSTDQFEIEFWMYPKSISGQTRSIFNFTNTQGSLDVLLYISSSSNILLYDGGNITSDSGGGLTINTWHHVVVSRALDNKIRIYLDGQLHQTSSGTFTAALGRYLDIGYYGDSRYFDGHIEDFRVTKGLSRYPFIPTQETLTAVSNTELLAAHASTLVDGSGNSATLTAAGNAAVSTFGPYSGMNSIYFDGNGDYVTSSRSSSDMGIGTGDFTIECWFYDDGSASDRGIWESRATGSSTGMTLTMVDSNTIRVWTTSQQLVTADVTLTSTWNHLAVVRNSGTLELFLNGQSQGTVSNSTTFADTADFVIGGGRYAGGGIDRTIKGYISNFRIVKSALYSNSFTPPTSELTG